MDEPRIRYIEAIQQVITRMANNSFLIKGWTITLVAAIFAVAAQSDFWGIVWIALLPTFAFWFLDTYYLRQERLFRLLHSAAISQSPPPLFSMSTAPFSSKETYRGVAFSHTVWPLHTMLLVSIFVVGLTKVCYPRPDESPAPISTTTTPVVDHRQPNSFPPNQYDFAIPPLLQRPFAQTDQVGQLYFWSFPPKQMPRYANEYWMYSSNCLEPQSTK